MKIKKYLFIVLLLLYSVVVFAKEVTVNGIKYNVAAKTKTAEVVAGGNYYGDIFIPATIEYNGELYNVTSIGKSAFYGCDITSVEIPNSITSIKEVAFYACPKLATVYISDLYAWCKIDFAGIFYTPFNLYLNKELLTELVIPNDVTIINWGAFTNCLSLKNVVLSNSVTSIATEAFYGCSGIESFVIGNSVTSIGNYTFYNCSGLKSIVIPNSVTSLGYSVFEGCSELESVVISNRISIIESYAFYGTKLKSIVIPNNVKKIEAYVFKGCSALESVTIGTSVNYIGDEAFASCNALYDVYCLATAVPKTTTAFDNSYPQNITLHVPAEAIDDYRATYPWNRFGTIVELDGHFEGAEEPEVRICTAPVVLYSNGKLKFESETEGAEFVTEVICVDNKRYYDDEIELTVTYNISVYATAAGYDNSDTVNATLCWLDNENGNNGNGVITIPATAVLITSSNGVIHVKTQLDGDEVAVYTTDGILISTSTIENGEAVIQSSLSRGSVAIIKIGEKSVKVIVG